MKKIIVALVLAQMLISGCSLFKKPPQKAVNDGIAEFANVKKMQSSFLLTGIIKSPTGEKPGQLTFSIDASGKTDVSDKQSPKLDTSIQIKTSIDDKNSSATFMLRTFEKKMFLNIKDIILAGDSGTELKTQLTSLLQKWWMLPTGEVSPIGSLLDEQKKLQEGFKTTKFFTNAVKDTQEEIHGIANTRYRVELDKEVLKKFLLDFAQTTENKITPEDELAVGESLKDVEFSGAVWIGSDDILHRIRGTILMTPAQGPSSSFEIDYQAWDYDKDVEIALPEAPQEFSAAVLVPLLGIFGPLDSVGTTGASVVLPAAPPASKKVPGKK